MDHGRGGPLSQEAGDKIITKTRLENSIGSTESGWFPFISHEKEDWNYFVPHPLGGCEFRKFSDNLYQLWLVRAQEFGELQATFHTFPELNGLYMFPWFSGHLMTS